MVRWNLHRGDIDMLTNPDLDPNILIGATIKKIDADDTVIKCIYVDLVNGDTSCILLKEEYGDDYMRAI